jgi:short-subunit dehydrogenase
MNSVMIIGGSSGIGRELALNFARRGNRVMVVGRNEERLIGVKDLHPNQIEFATLDINRLDSPQVLNRLVSDFGNIDIFIHSAGGGDPNEDLNWTIEDSTISLNVRAFARTMQWAYGMMQYQGAGQLVGITSIAGLRGFRQAPAYSAAKSFQIRYLEALRHKAYKENHNIYITDIRPGFVATKELKHSMLASPSRRTASQIFHAIRKKKKRVYVTRRWVLPAALLSILPGRVIAKL